MAADIVVILPMKGRFSQAGELLNAGLKLAYENQPRKYRSNINLVIVNNSSNPDSTYALAERYAADTDVIAILGGYPSECCREVTEVAGIFEIPHLIISSSEDSLTIDNSEWIFRIAPPSSHYNDGLVGWAATVAGNHRPVAVICESHQRSRGAAYDLRNDFETVWQGEITYHLYDPGHRRNERLIETLNDANPTLAWMIGNKFDVSRQLRDFRNADWIPVAFVLGDVNLVTPDLYSLSEETADYVYAPMVWWHTFPYMGVGELVDDFTSMHGKPPDYHVAEAYAAMQVIAYVIGNLDRLERDQVREALNQCEMQTVMGKVRFDAFSGFQNQNRVQTAVLQLIDGTWQTVWPLELADTDFVYPIPDWNDRETKERSDLKKYWLPLMMMLITGFMVISAMIRRKELMKRLND